MATRVLVVDDDRAVRESLRRSLSFNGYSVSLATDGVEALEAITSDRPDAMILSYPVITSGEFAHRNSFKCLLAEREEELKDVVSLEKHVTPDTPPTFLWHTWTDELVPVENSLMFAAALRRAGVPCEMHIFGAGQHGLSLCNDQVYDAEQPNMHAECACWIDMAARWLKGL